MDINDLLKCNFCDLFGFNDQCFPVARMPIRIGNILIPEHFVIARDTQVGGFFISKHIDDYALVFIDEYGAINLHMFVSDDCRNKVFNNYKAEKRLYKYGNKIYLKEAYEKGIFKVFSALKYLKMEDDEARHDNEFVTSSISDGSKYTVTFTDKNNGKAKKIKPIGNVKNNYIMTVDYYMLNLSYAWDLTLFKVFKDSDSCLIINEPVEFSKRIHSAFREQHPGYIGTDSRVSYGNQVSPFGPLFTKDKRYIIQREYRFVWVPEQCNQRLDPLRLQNNDKKYFETLIEKPLDLYVRDLGDIAELVDKL